MMKEHWYLLREFESSDLVVDYVNNKYGYCPSKEKVFEITSFFTQGREFFESASKSDISVMPILQYYGILALSRGLILVSNKSARENSIKSSHGLVLSNWDKKFENISVKITNGTFLELISSTNNVSHIRRGCSAVNLSVPYPIPNSDLYLNMVDIAFCFPDLSDQVRVWLKNELPKVCIRSFNTTEDTVDIALEGTSNTEVLNILFPPDRFNEVEISYVKDVQHAKYKLLEFPVITQKWDTGFPGIGDAYLSPPMRNGLMLNLISTYFAMSFILCMISRYYPSVWQKVHKGISNDRIMPFTIKLLDLITDRYPQIIEDFLKAPYSFE